MICVGYILCQKIHPTWKISKLYSEIREDDFFVDAPIPSIYTKTDDTCQLRCVVVDLTTAFEEACVSATSVRSVHRITCKGSIARD